MNAIRRWALHALLLGVASSVLAQDELILGSPLPAAAGEVARVPIFFRDVPGTFLGAGGVPIQTIDLSIMHSHPHVVAGCLGTTYPNCDLRFEPAGVLAESRLATMVTLRNIASLYARRIFDEPLPFTGGLDPIGFIVIRLDPKAPSGTEILLQFDPAKTLIADRSRTVIDNQLKLVDASLVLGSCPDAALPGTPSFDFLGTVSGCSSVSGLCCAGEDIEFATVIHPMDPCDTLTWSFGDGGIATNVSTVRHRFTLPEISPPVTYTVTATATRSSGSAVFSRFVTVEAGCTACP